LTLSAQVTLKVPSATGLDVNSIQSAIGGVEWQLHSRVLAPEEDASAAYLSFGPVFTAGTPPAFGWVAGEEKRIFSFKAEQGCLTGVALLANSDPFNQLPNSVSTNPGNQFTNIGWPSSNNYIGNYGHPVYCGTRPDERECRRSRGQVRSYDLRIQTLQNQIDKLERMRLQLEQMQDGLEGRKGYLIEQCDIE
ncbi:MAG: hypothetical protein KDI15_02875, partial [Thiothrix sp.]|nr:hypothetical protein [Thiothrix sp.]